MPKKFIFISATAVILAFLIFYGLEVVQSDSNDNVFGFVWSENIGWISFNSINCDSNCDGITDTGNYPQCPEGLSISSYGVDIDEETGNFSGYAWSENIGWISFNESDTGAPPSDDPCSDASCIAKAIPPGQLGKSDVDVIGWARALSYGDGWDGWLKFGSSAGDNAAFPLIFFIPFPLSFGDINYGVSIGSVAGDFSGWAWGDDVTGWVSFNSSDPGAGGSAYKAGFFSEEGAALPTVTSPDVSNPESEPHTYCDTATHYFSWVYSDADEDTESRFDFQADDNSDFSSPEVDRTYSGLSYPSPTTNNQTVFVVTSPGPDHLGYNTDYYWRVQVWDEYDNPSGWVEGPSFTTALHQYPAIDFTWAPLDPSSGEDVLFADQTTVFGGATKSAWSWTFEDGNPEDSSQQNPTVQFTSDGSKQVTLEVTDSDGFCCPFSKTVNTKFKLPFWKEILPGW